MSLLTKLAPTSASIQKEYVDKRKRELWQLDKDKVEKVKAVVERLRLAARLPVKTPDEWLQTYLKIHANLQRAELTINFQAASWFLNGENRYEHYDQMYTRAVDARSGKIALKNDDPKNPAVTRAIADDLVTLPDEWAHAHPFSQRKRLYDALSMTGAKKGANLLDATAGNAPRLRGDSASGYGSSSKFKPKAKQTFAALNYAGRTHGANVFYGHSHLVLDPQLKADALYYPTDTFYATASGTRSQETFQTLGALLVRAGEDLRKDLWTACHNEQRICEDTTDGALMIEAHLFRRIKVNRDVKLMRLCRQRKVTDTTPPLESREWETIQKNAAEWCMRNGVKYVVIG